MNHNSKPRLSKKSGKVDLMREQCKQLAIESDSDPPISVVSSESGSVAGVAKAKFVSVLAPHHNKNFPRVTYSIPHSLSFTQAKIAAVSYYHPIEMDSYRLSHKDNAHPFCAAMRAIGEAWALNELIGELGYIDSNIIGESNCILDVGGAVNRHHQQRRDYVWSCVPDVDGADLYRRFTFRGNKYCGHKWHSCACQKFLASMSVHSLYYVDPNDMLNCMLLKQAYPVHYALVHMYPDQEGEIMMGEMKYRKSADGNLHVRAVGNLKEYVHPVNDWMAIGQYNGVNGTLVWESLRSFGDSVVLRFVATRHRKNMPIPFRPIEKVDSSISESDYDDIISHCFPYGAPFSQSGYSTFLASVSRRAKQLGGFNLERLAAKAAKAYVEQPEILPDVTPDLHAKIMDRLARSSLVLQSIDMGRCLRVLARLFLIVSSISLVIYAKGYMAIS